MVSRIFQRSNALRRNTIYSMENAILGDCTVNGTEKSNLSSGSTIDCAISVNYISPYCRLHFSLVHFVLKRFCSPQSTIQRSQLNSFVRKACCENKLKSTLLKVIFKLLIYSRCEMSVSRFRLSTGHAFT